jgi:mono/diheme cytochrome c family protein
MTQSSKIKQLLLIGAILTFTITTPGLAETGKAPDPEAVERGLTLFESNCQQCHQAEGVGEYVPPGLRHPDFIPAIPLNENSHAWHHGDEQLVQTIRRGNKRMPPFDKVLSDPQLRDVVAYMKSLWSPRILACQGPKHMSCM